MTTTILAAIKADPTPWFADHANLLRLGHWLVDEEFYSGAALLRFFEKPWKWADEWEKMTGLSAGTMGHCDECGEITDQKTDTGLFVCPMCIPF